VITAGLDGQVRIWNMLTGALVSSWPSGAGAFWDAALIDAPSGAWLLCGCEDGAVRAWSVADSLLRAVLRRGVGAARVLAIGVDRAMVQREEGVTVRVWATAVDGGVAAWSLTLQDEGAVMNSTPSHEFLLPAVEHWTTRQNRERSRRQRLRDSRVMGWRILCYQSGGESDEHKRVLIGDSAGRVTAWQVSTSTLIQTLHNPVFAQSSRKNQRTENVNNTDVLALQLVEMLERDSTAALPANKKRKLSDGTAVSKEHVVRQLFVSGVDSTVFSYRHDEHKDEWIYLDKRRDTSHDTQCAIVLHRDTTYSPQHINWLLIAGVDPALHLYKLEAHLNLAQSTHHVVVPHSHHPEQHYALTTVNQTDQQLLLVQYKHCCQLWHVPPSATSETGPVLLLTVHVTTARGIECSALAPNGEWLAVSADEQLKLFKLHYELDEQELLYRAEVTKVQHSFNTRGPIAQLRFVPAISEQAPRLVVGTVSHVLVLDLQRMQSLGQIARETQHSIDQLAINVLGDKLAVLDNQHQRVCVYSLASLQVSVVY
jgi:WD40 repeat protein